MRFGQVFFLNIIITAVLFVPVVLVDLLFEVVVFCLELLLRGGVPGDLCEPGDIEGGEGLLGDRVNPEQWHLPFSRSVVHPALPTLPVVTYPLVLNSYAVIADREGELSVMVHRVEQFEVLLEEALFGQELLNVLLVAGELVVVVLHPGEKGRIVRMPDAEGRAGVLVEGIVEIVQCLDPREKSRRVLAEHHHKLRIPDPDHLVPEPFVHIPRLDQPRLVLDVVFRLLPGGPVEVYIFRFSVKYRRGNLRLFLRAADSHQDEYQ